MPFKFNQTLLFFLVLNSCSGVSNQQFQIVDLRSDIVIPKNYLITKHEEPINIDGIASESAWAAAPYSDNFIDIEGLDTPTYTTRMKMIWDNNYLYVYSELEEPHIWANLKQRDTIIYYNNDFEVFIDPSCTARNYGEIEINALNTVWDLYLDKPYRVGGKANFSWNLPGLISAVHIYGTLNNSTDLDSMWTVEMAIPLGPLMQLKGDYHGLPREGDQWRINFSRVEWDFDVKNGVYSRKKAGDKFMKEHNWVWSNQKVINMHEPEKWGYVQFTESGTTENIRLNNDPDLMIKQAAYALFRRTRFGDLKSQTEEKNGFQKDLMVKYSEEEPLIATFFKTNFGFEYKIESPVTRIVYIINEEGVLKTIS